MGCAVCDLFVLHQFSIFIVLLIKIIGYKIKLTLFHGSPHFL